MESVSFELSRQGVSDAASVLARDFVFVVGGVQYPCCRFQACALSGLVRRLLASNCCLSRLCLEVADEQSQFKDVVSLMNGQKISITPENAPFLVECARELENDELLGCIIGFQLDGNVSMSNVIDRIRIKAESHSDYQSELDFLASHFFDADLDVLGRLSISDLERVLTNPLLKLESEDQLYEKIVLLAAENGAEHLSLLRYVDIAFLSEHKLGEFLDRIFPDLVDGAFWELLCQYVRRFCGSSVKDSLRKTARYKSIEGANEPGSVNKAEQPRIEFDEFTRANGAFDGIVNHMRSECGGNPHQHGVISITGTNDYLNQRQQLVDYGWNNYWVSFCEVNAFVQFDFKSRRVCLSQYSLKSDGSRWGHLLSWVIEVSDDGSTWEVVDERNTQDLNGEYLVRTYECNRRSDRFVRYVRLRQTGENSGCGYCLYLSEIEFFGKLTK